MKNIKCLFITSFVLFLSITEIQAQYGNGYGNNGYGRRRRSSIPATQTPQKEVKPPTAKEIVAGQMPKITELLELNAFEQAIMSTTLIKYVQQRIEIQILELTPEKTKESFEQIHKKQDAELKENLPADKYEAFVALQEDGFKRNKKKKKKKSKKKRKSKSE
ncbi:MAG: hypothetical protein V3U92_20575 [Cellulophaga sp.]